MPSLYSLHDEVVDVFIDGIGHRIAPGEPLDVEDARVKVMVESGNWAKKAPTKKAAAKTEGEA